MPEVVIERPLGPGENYFRCRTELGFYYSFASVATYSRDLTLDLPLVYRALRKTLLDYHIFACNVFKDFEKGICLVRPIKLATLGDFLLFSDKLFTLGETKKPASEQRLNELCRSPFFKFNDESPLFKAILYGTHDLGAAFEHTLFDGVVSMYFHEILLENLAYCDKASNDKEYIELYGAAPEEVTTDTTIFNYAEDRKYLRNSIAPPLELVMQDPEIDYSDNDPNHYSKVPPAGYPEKWPGRFPATKDVSVAFKLFNIRPEQFSVILKKCKENGSTFTSYLNYIQALALRSITGDKHHTLTMVAITLRRFLTPEKVGENYADILKKDGYRIVGNYPHMGVPELIPPLSEFSWDHVREILKRLAQSVNNDKLLNMSRKWYSEASDVYDNEPFFEPLLGNNKADTVKISNVGLARVPVFDIGAGKAPWSIDDMVFAQDMAPAASEFVFNVVSTPRGGLNIVMTFYDHRFDDSEHDNFDKYPELVREMLLKYAGI